MATGRNEPCPCGSAKKYKHCCLAAATATAPTEPDAIAAQRKAHDWLQARLGKAQAKDIENTFLGLVRAFPPPEGASHDASAMDVFLDRLGKGGTYTLNVGINDWALHETDYQRHGNSARGIDWVLRAGDLHLNQAQRVFLQAAAASHLHVYEVTAVEPERGLHLRDVLRPDIPARFVREVAATRGLDANHLIGARVIEHDEAYGLGGAIYPLSPIGVLELLKEASELHNSGECVPDRFPAWLIRDSWLLDRVQSPLSRALPQSIPPCLDDRYDVIDAEALQRALAENVDIVDVGEPGFVWIRDMDDLDSAIVFKHPPSRNATRDSSILHCRTPDTADADASRAWLEALAGASVRHREREQIEPSEEDGFRLPLPSASRQHSAAQDPTGLTAEERAAELHGLYANWCDQPLSILGERSPRALLANPVGRYRVELLLRFYDDIERALARVEQRSAVTFDFLREQLGFAKQRIFEDLDAESPS